MNTTTQCPGVGRPWGSGTGQPICPVCHRGFRFLGVRMPNRRKGRGTPWIGTVPPHQGRAR